MRNSMQRMRQLLDALNSVEDSDEREAIQEEIWLLEEIMEQNDDDQYKDRHFNSRHDVFQ